MHEKSYYKKVETINESDVKNDDNFVDYDNLNSVDDIDDNIKTNTFLCDICQYTSNVKSSLRKHIQNDHKKMIQNY